MDIVSTDPNRPGFFAFGQYAVGVVAFGQAALGIIAVGQIARGVFCVGQCSVGVVCIGQGAVGLWHATGMIGIGGQGGYGLVLHTLPRLTRAALPELAPPTPIEDLRERRVEGGWLDARLLRDEAGAPKLGLEVPARIDTSAIDGLLAGGIARGCDRAHVRVRADVTVDPGGYREAEAHIDLVGEDAIVYWSKPPARLAYGTIPRGAPGEPATPAALVVRSGLFLVLLAIVVFVSLLPLTVGLLGLQLDFLLNRG